jgi:CRP/FNR family transcriptional regulator, cyclic AMP receptor protein
MNDPLLLDTLREVRFLHDISTEHLEQITEISHLCDVDKRRVIFREGDIAKYLYLVVFGNVSLEICAPGLGCRRILTVGPGELLAWSALLDQSRLTATARAIEATQLVKIEAAQLLALCEQDPRFACEIMRRAMLAMATRLSATRMQLLDVYGPQLPAAAHVAGEKHGR